LPPDGRQASRDPAQEADRAPQAAELVRADPGARGRDRRPRDGGGGVLHGDHWHIAYGVYDCDKYLPASQEQNDPLGIHTHGDGLIHVHPYDVSTIGDGARLARFTDAIGAELTDDHYRPGAGEAGAPELTAGQGCGDKPSELVIAYWPDALKDAKPELITKDLADFHFTRDGSAVAIALVPQGTTEIPLPPVIEQLQNPSDT
jgi:hypothetical protein